MCSSTAAASAAATTNAPPLHTVIPMPQKPFNRVFALIYASAILSLLYHHFKTLFISFSATTLILLISDTILAFMWINTQTTRMCPIYRQQFPENLEKVLKKRSEFPGLDVFICTADPYKEPPVSLVNTALSVMAYDYPVEKISVYVSDDGGSALTLFALMEAAKFAAHWLPFCQKNRVVERSPEAYFKSNHRPHSSETENIKIMYERLKLKIEHVLERGGVDNEFINGVEERKAFNKWTDKFTPQDHPTVIQVLLDNSKDRDIIGQQMPSFIYVSRQKSKTSPHHFKAGALNVLLRVSATMTNAPIILTQDCDMYSNDPKTPLLALCYFCDLDPSTRSKIGFVQFPQKFHGLNKNDIYACAYERLYQIQPMGFDGLLGPHFLGSGCFFSRRVFFGNPSTLLPPEIPELGPYHVVDKPLQSQSVLALAHQVAGCNYENRTNWGTKIGFSYGSLSEDFLTGLLMHSKGWKSVFCNPKTAAFRGDAPITLMDLLAQQKRWTHGVLQVGFSKYSPITFGIWAIGPLMALGYAQSTFWAFWAFPITIYAFLPQLALINQLHIFPKVSESPWFLLYLFLFLGAYGQDFLDFILVGGSVKSWWNDQRIWHIRGLTCYLFGSIEFILKKLLRVSSFGFNVTSKTVDDEVSKRYEQGIFEFGVHSPMFVTLTMAALINLISLIHGLLQVFKDPINGPFLQLLLAGFIVLNCWPVYEAIIMRTDGGKMPIKTTTTSTFLACCLYLMASFIML